MRKMPQENIINTENRIFIRVGLDLTESEVSSDEIQLNLNTPLLRGLKCSNELSIFYCI